MNLPTNETQVQLFTPDTTRPLLLLLYEIAVISQTRVYHKRSDI